MACTCADVKRSTPFPARQECCPMLWTAVQRERARERECVCVHVGVCLCARAVQIVCKCVCVHNSARDCVCARQESQN